jgi:succinate dehydrogenase / fumarate reductase flavoprotein subunit
MAANPRIVIVGGGLAGLSAAIKCAEMGALVDLFSIVPVKRSHSVCAQGGINAAKNLKGEGDTTWQHFDDTVYGGDFLADQGPVKAMCDMGPAIIDLLDRMGVPFNRTPEGLLDFRRFGGTLFHRTAFAGATTGQQLLYALDEQVRRYESEGKVKKFESWEFLSGVIDSGGVCRGICAMDLRTMEVRCFPAEAVIMATGGVGAIFGKSTNSVVCTGSAQSALYQQGAYYSNGEFIQVHPTSIPGEDKLRLMSESARGEGGRVWVPKAPGDKRAAKSIPENERFYFLEEWYPKYGNLVPRDVATRAIHKVVHELHLGVDGSPMVYLDLTHIDRETLNRKLEGILEIYEKFVGDDPRDVPMKIFPGMHYTMGGIWVDENQVTNIPGLYACGECDFSIHGANRLGANSLLSCIYGGFIAGPHAVRYGASIKSSADNSQSALESERRRQLEMNSRLITNDGTENPFRLWREMGDIMSKNVTVTRYNNALDETDAKLVELLERYRHINVGDRATWANTTFAFTRQLYNMLQLARVITQGARLRDESRGAHYKPDFPDRNDEKFLKTTKAYFAPDADEPRFEYAPVDTSLIQPRLRKYA